MSDDESKTPDPLNLARAAEGGAPRSDWKGEKIYFSKFPPVEGSADLDRVLALPRRAPIEEGSEREASMIALAMQRWSRGDRACRCAEIDPRIASGKRRCLKRANGVQAWALYELGIVGGLIGSIPVGKGKTFLDIMAPMALELLGIRMSLLLVPASLIKQLKRDYLLISEHFKTPSIEIHPNVHREVHGDAPFLHVLPYSLLSRDNYSSWIRNLNPQAIIADECDRIKDPNGAGSSRVLRQFQEQGSTRFAGWTGSLTDHSIVEYAHLMAIALRLGSPLPLTRSVIEEWAGALDAPKAGADKGPPGELERLCDPRVDASVDDGYRRRLSETMGVVISTSSSVEAELVVMPRRAPRLPAVVADALDTLRADWVRPDGEELVDAMQMHKCALELASGVFYQWYYPPIGGVAQRPETIKEWKQARKEWHQELRSFLFTRREFLDSPLLCEHAAERFYGHRPKRDDRPEWESLTYPRWRAVKTRVVYQPVGVRVSDYLAMDAATWARENLGIVWYANVEFGQWVAELSGLPMHGGGAGADERINAEDGDRSIIASIKSHGRGRDGLQTIFDQGLVAQPPSSATMWEQCLDMNTEVLTDRGWLNSTANWDDVRAAAYDLSTGSIEWAQAHKIERRLGDESMFGIENPHLDIRVTAGHRMVIQRPKHTSRSQVFYQPREFVEASMIPNVCRIPVAGLQQARGVALTEPELIFLGLFMSDGNLDPSNNVLSLFQSERYPQVIALIEEIIIACGFKARRSVDTRPTNFGSRSPLHIWKISKGTPRNTDKHLRGWGQLADYIDKDFPLSLDTMTREQLLSFLRGYWAGDGNKTAGTYEYDRYKVRTLEIATRRKTAADRIQSLCVRRGMRCNITAATAQLFKLRISVDDDTWQIRTQASDGRPVWRPMASRPDERVWCVQVSTGAIITRRYGKVAVVGNCLGRLHRQGQDSAVVTTYFYDHTPELFAAFEQAKRRAQYVEGTTGSRQKLRFGVKE